MIKKYGRNGKVFAQYVEEWGPKVYHYGSAYYRQYKGKRSSGVNGGRANTSQGDNKSVDLTKYFFGFLIIGGGIYLVKNQMDL